MLWKIVYYEGLNDEPEKVTEFVEGKDPDEVIERFIREDTTVVQVRPARCEQ